MHDTATSPNDPSFWLHHANVDRLAENWWALNEYEFLPVTGGPIGGNIDDTMSPYEFTNGDMATPTEDLGYTYDQPESETVPQDGAASSSLETTTPSHSGH
jgi:tyrosinase